MQPLAAASPVVDSPWRVLELFAGIGGLAHAWPEVKVVAALDINTQAASVYRRSLSHPYQVREIESLSDELLGHYAANLWWLSPPCQPFTRRGQQRDVADRRTRGLQRIVEAIAACRPQAIGLENVVGFLGSRASERLLQCLADCGYQVAIRELCPSHLGWPNRRPRVYLLAARERLRPWRAVPRYDCRLQDLLSPAAAVEPAAQHRPGESNGTGDTTGDSTGDSTGGTTEQELWLPTQYVEKYWSALDRIEVLSDDACTACFAASYGKTLLHAGSYLRVGNRYRRFSPREVARLLGFPDSLDLAGVPTRAAWKLLGNSLSLPAVRYVLS
ncbi:MAG: DNA cytosine methyltransferase, partial [Planctomycetales bacterium]|nr:DNA cytosine methyltransferase [Planctomycetales bacterium]